MQQILIIPRLVLPVIRVQVWVVIETIIIFIRHSSQQHDWGLSLTVYIIF
jgi:hypothetical protein